MATPPPLPRRIEGRRARQRRELLAAIEAEARRLLEEGGAGNVSMRAIARGVGLGPASLYTYFDSLDDIFTLLLLSSYKSLATPPPPPSKRSRTTRRPSGPSPASSPTAAGRWPTATSSTCSSPTCYPATRHPPAAQPSTPRSRCSNRSSTPSPRSPPGTDLTVEQAGIVVWCAFHGAVALEVNHHLDWIDDPAAAPRDHRSTSDREHRRPRTRDPPQTLRPLGGGGGRPRPGDLRRAGRPSRCPPSASAWPA